MLRIVLRSAVVLGLAACLASPWIDQQFYWLGWIGLGGFLYLRRSLAPRAAVLWTLLYSFAALAIAFYWAPAAMAYTIRGSLFLGALVTLPILLAEAARLALPLLLVPSGHPSSSQESGATTHPVRAGALPQWLWLAVFAVALETVVPTVFPWRLGYLQVGAPLLNQFASIAGPSVSTLSVFAFAALVCEGMAHARCRLGTVRSRTGAVRPERRELWTAAVFIGLNFLWGLWTFGAWEGRLESSPTRKFALVQVDPSYTDSLHKMRRITQEVDSDTVLVCWPESSIGCYSVGLKDFTDRKQLLRNSRMPLRGEAPMRSPNCEILAGGKSYEGPQRGDQGERVSAYLIDRQERILDRYDKTRLMPFGEYVPGAQVIPGLTTLFGFGENPALTGHAPRALTSSWGGRLGVMMCYEDLIPGVARDLVRDGAQVLIVLINGVAFDSPHALLQHRQLACLRAVENRRYLLRTASTGSTCVIDPLGRIVAELPVQTEGVLQVELALLDGRTPFNRLGNVFGWTCVLVAGAGLLWGAAEKRLRNETPPGGAGEMEQADAGHEGQ